MSVHLLEKVISATSVAEPLSATEIKCSQCIIQVQRGNAAALEIGDSTLASGKGIEFVKPTTDVQLPSLSIEGKGGNPLNLAELYVFGTKDDGVNILYEIY
jgi:hypothetical protein